MFFFQGCLGSIPSRDEMVGSWMSSDSAKLIIFQDGTFTSRSLPAEYFSFYVKKQEVIGKKIDGKGKWKLENDQGSWEVKLEFEEINKTRELGFYFVLVARNNSIIEQKPSWYLFLWKQEEGGDRYKFKKI